MKIEVRKMFDILLGILFLVVLELLGAPIWAAVGLGYLLIVCGPVSKF